MAFCAVCSGIVLPSELIVAGCCCECGAIVHEECETRRWLESGVMECVQCKSRSSSLPGFLRTEKLFGISRDCYQHILALLEYINAYNVGLHFRRELYSIEQACDDDVSVVSDRLYQSVYSTFFGRAALAIAPFLSDTDPNLEYVFAFVKYLFSEQGLSTVALFICHRAIKDHFSNTALALIDEANNKNPHWKHIGARISLD